MPLHVVVVVVVVVDIDVEYKDECEKNEGGVQHLHST